ncbi:hypothetical protein ABPG74_021459 [Tetrahymena malaccensis]
MLPAPISKQCFDTKQAMQKQSSQQSMQTSQRQNTVTGAVGQGSSNSNQAEPQQSSTGTQQTPALPQVLKHVDNYIVFNEKLGGGQFSQVYKAMDKNDKTHEQYFAVKIIPMSSTQYQKFANYNQLLQKEIEILLKARHQNLICMHDLKQTPNNLYLFLDYCNGGDLRQYIVKKKNRLAEEEAVEFFKQMCAGYQALNEKKIIHRDLKPENILLHDNKIKIGDFGFARIVNDLDQAVRMTQKCSPLYAPPQILLNEKYSSKCDVWSMGCIFFEMLYGKPPFTAHSIISLTENIKKMVGSGPYQLPAYPPIAQEAKDILVKMLMYNEKDRISWDEIFNHPILQKHLQKKVVENVQIEPSTNPLYQSIRKNLDAVWENAFKPVQPALPPIQTITAVPGSNQTLFNNLTQNDENKQLNGQQVQALQIEKNQSTPSNNTIVNCGLLPPQPNTINGIGVVNTGTITAIQATTLNKAISSPCTEEEKKNTNQPKQEIQIQRHDRRYSQYAQTVVPSQPPIMSNNTTYLPATNTDRGNHNSNSSQQNKENILKRANSINILDNRFDFQQNKNQNSNNNNNNNFETPSNIPLSGAAQTERRKESGRSHTINYTSNVNNPNSLPQTGYDSQQNSALQTPKQPYTPQNMNSLNSNNQNTSSSNSNKSLTHTNSSNSTSDGQTNSLSYRERSNNHSNTLVEKYGINYKANSNLQQQQKENMYRNAYEKEKALSFHQTAPLSNLWNTATTPTSGGIQSLTKQNSQGNQNGQFSTKNATQTIPSTPTSNQQNYFIATNIQVTTNNFGTSNQNTINNNNQNSLKQSPEQKTQTLSSIANKDKEIIAKIEENKDLTENEKYVLYMKQIKIKEAERAFVSKIDNFFSFMRKRALFANATLLNFWNSTRQFKLPSDFQCAILYCLCSYYYYGLEYLRKILFKETEQKVIKKDGFEVYQRSAEFQQTKDIISRDVLEAKQLFTDIEPFMINEIQLSQSQSPEAQEFIKFISNKSIKHDEYRVKLQQIFYKSLQFIDLNTIDRTASKGIHMTQIFTHIEDFIPSKQYNEFDFNKFYDDRFNNTTLEEFKVAINIFNQKYYALPNIK